MKCLELALGRGVEAVERAHDLPAGENVDPEAAAAHLLDDLRELLGRALVQDRGRPGGGQSPLDLRLCDNVRSIDDRSGSSSRHHAPRCQ